MFKIISDLLSLEAKESDTKRENANIDSNAPMGIMLQFGSEVSKKYCLDNIIKHEQAEAHINGTMHIHDLNFYPITFNCCQIPAGKLLHSGFSTGHGYIREPNSIQTASALMCIILQANQNEMFGGQAIPTFEYDLAPYVVKSFIKNYLNLLDYEDCSKFKENVKTQIEEVYNKFGTLGGKNFYFSDANPAVVEIGERISKEAWKLTIQDTYQGMEAIIHNLNTMQSRAGAQVPFSSINYGTGTTFEQRLIIKSVLEATEKGLGNGETPIFPVQVFKCKDGVNTKQGDPNYDLFQLACKTSALRLFPNFSFLDSPYNLQYYKEGHPETELAVMGCRTRVMGNIHDKDKEIPVGRGNIAFTTINLPRLGIISKGDLKVFYAELDKVLTLSYENLLDRFNLLKTKHAYNFPFLLGEDVWMGSESLYNDDTIEEVLKHGSLSIGFIGLAECLVALIGKHHGESEEAQELGLSIISYMRKFCDDRAKETNLNFSLFATPAEGLSGRFVKIDRKKYGEIKGVTDRDYYTNSSHVPVYFDISAAKKITIEAPYHELCNAGHICYVEVNGDISKNIKAFESIILHMKNSKCTYGSINHPVDFCPVCGYVGIIQDTCPKCGRKDEEGVTIEHLHTIGCKC